MKRLHEIMLDDQVELLLEKERGHLFDVIPILQLLTIEMPDTKNLWNHTRITCARVSDDPALRWAALFHDIGKPVVFKVSKGSTFPNHAAIGAEIWKDNSRRFVGVLYQSAIDRIEVLIRYHMQMLSYGPKWSDQAVKRLMELYRGDMLFGIILARADGGDHNKLKHLKDRMLQIGDSRG